MNKLIARAIKITGGQTALANAISPVVDRKITQSHVWTWLNRDKAVPAEYCRAIEHATNGQITACQLRPDVFGDCA